MVLVKKTVAAGGDLSPHSRAAEDSLTQASSQCGEEELERSNMSLPRGSCRGENDEILERWTTESQSKQILLSSQNDVGGEGEEDDGGVAAAGAEAEKEAEAGGNVSGVHAVSLLATPLASSIKKAEYERNRLPAVVVALLFKEISILVLDEKLQTCTILANISSAAICKLLKDIDQEKHCEFSFNL
uniref:Uncharacterized protein n=1 Tax=Oryza punctata TaxID=4537 RepID=A0A0E0K4E5_ORYPU